MGTYVEVPTPNTGSRGNTPVDLIVVHTNESDFTTTAANLARYLARPDVQASYQLIVDKGGDVARSASDDRAAWAAGPIANTAGLHICWIGRAAYGREVWLSNPEQLEAGAHRIAQWARERGIPLSKRTPVEFRNTLSGAGGHVDVAQAWGETNHTDPGPGFPWDVVIDRAVAIFNGAATPTTPAPEGDDPMSDAIARDLLAQETGSSVLGEYPGWTERLYHEDQLPQEQKTHFTLTDRTRAIFTKVGSRLDFTSRRGGKGPAEDDLFGHVLTLRAEVADLRADVASLVKKGGA